MKGDTYWADISVNNFDHKITKKELMKILEGYDDDCLICVKDTRLPKTQFLRSLVLIAYFGNENISFNKTKELKFLGYHPNEKDGIIYNTEKI